MGPENAKHKVIYDLAMAGWYLLQAKDHLEELEHQALGDVERILDRLNEEYTGLLASFAKSPQRRNLK